MIFSAVCATLLLARIGTSAQQPVPVNPGMNAVIEAIYDRGENPGSFRPTQPRQSKISIVIVDGSLRVVREQVEARLSEVWIFEKEDFALYSSSAEGFRLSRVSLMPARGQAWLDSEDGTGLLRLLLTGEPMHKDYAEDLVFDEVKEVEFQRVGETKLASKIEGGWHRLTSIRARALEPRDLKSYMLPPRNKDDLPIANFGCFAFSDIGTRELWGQLLENPERIPKEVSKLID